MSDKKKKVVNPSFAKGDYKNVIDTIEEKGKCPFCPDNFIYHKHPVLKREGSWFITKQTWPYENSKCHFLIIGEDHKENIDELIPEDMKDILMLMQWAAKKFSIDGGGFAMRFGETSCTGSSVCHLHVHLIVSQKGKSVSFPVG